MDRETRLGLIAASILEGTPVDWSSVESASPPEDEVVVRHLKVLAEVAALHRGLAGDASPGATTTADVPDALPIAADMWGHLRLLEQVGRGSFGEVYRAWDTHLDREVALKLLRAAPTASRDASATVSDPSRVVHEGRLLARVRHPNVITVYGAERRAGTVGIWMEFIRGTTLHRLVEQQGRLGAREAGGIGTDLCRALAAVHGSGLLHRDITARNVMREDGGRVVLMDFGAGHEGEVHRDRANRVTGTPLYMAPELFTDSSTDHRTDIYALGTLLFFLATGQYPVAGRSLDEVRTAHARNNRTRLRDLRADLPAAFVRPIEQALEPDPRRRFQSAGEMEAALESALPGLSPGLSPAPSRAVWIAAAAATVAVTVVGTATFLSRGRGEPPAAAQAVVASEAFTARRIVSPQEVWLFSNPSDDGRYVVGGVSETGDAAVVDLSTGEYRPLGLGQSQDDGYASMGVLSPDGSVAAVDFHSHTESGGNLYVVRTDGSRPRLLIAAPSDASPYQWSRDGTMILALLEQPGQPAVAALIAVSDGAVRVVGELDGPPPTHMALSTDNRYIAYDAPERPGSVERDIFILDAHTGDRWPLEHAPGGDLGPFWSPDGRGLVFLSDRNRNPSLWFAPVAEGRLQGEPRLVQDGVGRVRLRGFTAAGAMHYEQPSGFAEVFLATVDGMAPPAPEPLSPRRAVSNFYPKWSQDGRFVAYAAERSDLSSTSAPRELWIYDTMTATEAQVPFDRPIGLPLGWSSDSSEVLVRAGGALHVVHRVTGRSRLVFPIKEGPGRPAWGPAGILLPQDGQVVLVDAATGRRLRTIGPSRDYAASPDGRSVIARRPGGRIALVDPATGVVREWNDAAEWVGLHFTDPQTAGVAYVAGRQGAHGEVQTLMYWAGAGDPRELLRVEGTELFYLVGWADQRTILAARWEGRSKPLANEPDPVTLWRVSIGGGMPLSTSLTMDGLRDVSIHPDGRRIAFNAGWRRYEHWVMEHLLPE